MKAEPIEVVVVRGQVIEARHRAHVVATQGGRAVLEAGDISLVTYFRSSAKPLQALPLVRLRPDLGDEEIAIACASHLARSEQIAAVRRLLKAAPADESELETGLEPTPLEHNCSGKHAGFLAVCRARGWLSAGYRLARRSTPARSRPRSTAAASSRSHWRSRAWHMPFRVFPMWTEEPVCSPPCGHTPI
jgi:L-asparaginase